MAPASVDPTRGLPCGIPGFDHPGTEYHTALLQSKEESPLTWDLEDVCGFATDFAYSS